MVVRFAPKRGRDVPLFVAGAADLLARLLFDKQPFDETTLDVAARLRPLQGRTLRGRAATSNTSASRTGGAPTCRSSRGQNNFDIVRYEFYRDRDVAFEGFTGKNYLFREEFTSRIWATRYDFPAIKDGRVKRDVTARRHAVGRAGLVHQHAARQVQGPARARGARSTPSISNGPTRPSCTGPIERTHSVFQNSDMMADGKPGADELALLEPFRGKVPDEVFGEPFVPPVSDGSGQDRALLRKATRSCCRRPAIVIKDGKRVTPKGERDHASNS